MCAFASTLSFPNVFAYGWLGGRWQWAGVQGRSVPGYHRHPAAVLRDQADGDAHEKQASGRPRLFLQRNFCSSRWSIRVRLACHVAHDNMQQLACSRTEIRRSWNLAVAASLVAWLLRSKRVVNRNRSCMYVCVDDGRLFGDSVRHAFVHRCGRALLAL